MAREMKNSGIEWIGDIPTNWSISKMKYIGQYINGYAFKPEDWGNTGKRIIRIQDLTRCNDNPNYYNGEIDKKYLVKAGDILVSWAATLDAFVWKQEDSWLNQHIFKATPNEKLIKYDFFYWLIKEAIHNMANENLHGIMMQHVTLGLFGNYSVPLPDLREQQKIADFLNRTCAEIDTVIEKTKTTIEEYKKLKQSVITEAITKGIRGERPMKDSGIEWIGDIPSDWKVIPLQYFVDLNKETLGENTPADYEFEYVEIGAVTLANGIEEYQHYKFSDAPSRARRVVHKGDIIVSTVRTYLKAIAIVPDKENVIVSTGFAVLTPKNICTSYLGWSLKSEYFVHTVSSNSVGISYPAINASDLIKFKIAIPNSCEQQEIADYLDRKCAEIDKLIADKTHLLEEMESYKKSVIYEYVTGKKEVVL